MQKINERQCLVTIKYLNESYDKKIKNIKTVAKSAVYDYKKILTPYFDRYNFEFVSIMQKYGFAPDNIIYPELDKIVEECMLCIQYNYDDQEYYKKINDIHSSKRAEKLLLETKKIKIKKSKKSNIHPKNLVISLANLTLDIALTTIPEMIVQFKNNPLLILKYYLKKSYHLAESIITSYSNLINMNEYELKNIFDNGDKIIQKRDKIYEDLNNLFLNNNILDYYLINNEKVLLLKNELKNLDNEILLYKIALDTKKKPNVSNTIINEEEINDKLIALIEFSSIASDYINTYISKNSHNKQGIYAFMKKYKIGESEYGEFIDILGRSNSEIKNYLEKNINNLNEQMVCKLQEIIESNVNYIAHRLRGHHLIADFPYNDLQKIPDFLEHVLISDFPTPMGLPIIPAKIVEELSIKKYCDGLNSNWNFINSFQLLSATISIYRNLSLLNKSIENNLTINSIETLAIKLGYNGLEIAIAISKANPFLLIGGIIGITSTLVELFQDENNAYFNKILESFSIRFNLQTTDLNYDLNKYNLNHIIEECCFKKSLDSYKI